MKLSFYIMFLKAQHAQRKAMAPYLQQFGLSIGQPKILNFLAQTGGCIQRELAEFLELEPATVSKLLDNMETSGLIQREVCQGNKRACAIRLTEKGKRAQQHMRNSSSEVQERALSGFQAQEREQFYEYLCRMYKNLTGKEMNDRGTRHGRD